MASLEVWTPNSITVYEEPDEGEGVKLRVRLEAHDGRSAKAWLAFGDAAVSGVWFEPIGSFEKGVPLLDAFDLLDKAQGWTEVKLNGQTIWASEALEAVQDALEEVR